MGGYILAIDQGTTSTRSMVFDRDMRVIGVGQREFPQHFPASGWVEHDAEDIWKSVLETIRLALADAGIAASDIEAIGITNQRETTVLWDRNTGEAVHRAVVWQDRRAAPPRGKCGPQQYEQQKQTRLEGVAHNSRKLG